MSATARSAWPRWEEALRAGSSPFQRGEVRGRLKRAPRRVLLRPKHVTLAVLALSALLFGLSRAYLFLIDWDALRVKTVLVDCRIDSARSELEAALAGCRLGNILLLDLGRLKGALERHRWVREAVVRRDFPSTLRVEIRERRPAAVLEAADGLELIDRDGVILETLASADGLDLPRLRDEDGFRSDAAEKLALAWACLDSLGPAERNRVDGLDLTEFGKVVLTLKDDPTRLILGGDRFPEKIARYLEAEAWLKSRFGPLDYVDLRLWQDRLTVRPLPAPPEPAPEAPLPTPAKEAE